MTGVVNVCFMHLAASLHFVVLAVHRNFFLYQRDSRALHSVTMLKIGMPPSRVRYMSLR
jgi:hypothetical protein